KDIGLLPQAWKYAGAVGAVGALLALAGFVADPHRFGYSYLFAFMTVLTFVFGGMFLVIAQHLTLGHWGVTTRRIVEIVTMGAVVIAVLALPLIAGVGTGALDLYDEWARPAHGEHGDHDAAHGEHGTAPVLFGAATAHADNGAAHGDEVHAHTPQEMALHHSLIEKKHSWLNLPFWIARAFVYLAVWIGIALFYFRNSRKQDETRDPKLTNRMNSFAAPMAIAFGLTLTFAAFDWLMALQPGWYSTIFGVIIFGGSATAILALTIVIGINLSNGGHVGNAMNVEHFHDLSRLMFGFICFWTYVGFSQWMLIWYAGIPEEAVWYHARWSGGWQWVSVVLVLGHWIVPFFLLMSRNYKRNLSFLYAMCLWVLAFHVLDIYWFVMPHATATPSFRVNWIDIGCLMFTGGVFFAFVFQGLKRFPLIPVGDPRLERSLHLHQTY
ncbi:MAG: hypothetical protein H5U40_10845, partial [Polyangiaceae bacterium]|nr:hypothetical protein [Polyangiaceae bacterium]